MVIGHGGTLLPESLQAINDFFVFDGVTIFFVLSGYLIGGIFINAIEKNGVNKKVIFLFWMRRWFRTLPSYFLILILLALLRHYLLDGFNFKDIYRYFFFSQNLAYINPSFFAESWSLSIEEWFYLLIPICITFIYIIFKVTTKQAIVFTSIALIGLVTSYRYYRYSSFTVNNFVDWDRTIRKEVFTRLDSLMFGLIGAYFSYYKRESWLKNKTLLFVLGILLMLITKYVLPSFTTINSLYSITFSFSLISIATLLLLPYLSQLKTLKGRFSKCITVISVISYAMYLLHLSIVRDWMINRIPWKNLVQEGNGLITFKYVLYWFILISISILFYKYFEIKMTSLRDNEKLKKWMSNLFKN